MMDTIIAAAIACAGAATSMYLAVMLRKERRRRNRALELVDEVSRKHEALRDSSSGVELRLSKLSLFLLTHFPNVPRVRLTHQTGPTCRTDRSITVLEGDPIEFAIGFLKTHSSYVPGEKVKTQRSRRGGRKV